MPKQRVAARILGSVCCVLVWVSGAFTLRPAHGEPVPRPSAPGYSADAVRQVLVQRCLGCHNSERPRGGLDIRTRESLLRGGNSGVDVTPGKSKDSPLCQMIDGSSTGRKMPPRGGSLPDSAIQGIAAWIDDGAPYDRPLDQ